MKGKLYGVGVGPGDPELITIKAKRILEAVQYIAVPKTSMDKESVALSIARKAIADEKPVIELVFPMSCNGKLLEASWEDASAQLKHTLDRGMDIAFITLGDPTVYSTYMYMHKNLSRQGYDTRIIPGITSFCASAARAGVSLGEGSESIAVIPGAFEDAELRHILKSFDNIIIMKAAKSLDKIKGCLTDEGMADRAVVVSRCGFDDELVTFGIDTACQSDLSYFTTMIIKKGGVG
ncbi:precorrin-2/cobalt-factor-2 C20-methyltransferase [Anaerobacterium chartisolvens]|uniref:Precorrin-2/cobalt-factor-2 C20-methyltransferase n=1 Tax=Anaerobacterium chartisolvens TaxID=1297424 RepID=A0A369BAN5_9FIRM|nr:precorrin-2 C(20)-methyltransferase [Anaerobacterium chartisolvens]RCX17577.1 precorrin-2/cobalt-factor-2 C20-methyltransferase [Anaerobacterium chartisolvens]